MPASFDLIVIGTGMAGNGAAHRCRQAGWRVAVVDDEPYGGTCPLRGCDPKRVLVGGAELADWHRRMRGWGIAGEARIDWPALVRFKRTFTDPVPASREAAFQQAGIAPFHGGGPVLRRRPPRGRCARGRPRAPRARGDALPDRERGRAAAAWLARRGASADEHRVSGAGRAAAAHRLRRGRLHRVRVCAPRPAGGGGGRHARPGAGARPLRPGPGAATRRPHPRARRGRAARRAGHGGRGPRGRVPGACRSTGRRRGGRGRSRRARGGPRAEDAGTGPPDRERDNGCAGGGSR